MVKKLDKNSTASKDSQLAKSVRESAHQIWLAGLGAYSKAQEEGNKVFDKLVREGTSLHKLTREFTDSKIAEVLDRANKVSADVSKQASETWDKLEAVFESRVARALSSLGVPTSADIQELTRRIESLTASVDELSKNSRSTAGAKRAPRRASAKRAPGKSV